MNRFTPDACAARLSAVPADQPFDLSLAGQDPHAPAGIAETDGERKEDPIVPRAGPVVQLLGLYHRAVLLATDGPCVHQYAAVEEEASEPVSGDPRVDPSHGDVPRSRRTVCRSLSSL